MNLRIRTYITVVLVLASCKHYLEREQTYYDYHNIAQLDTLEPNILLAVTDEEFLQFGSNVAYINMQGDTIIPFGEFAYFGTDTLKYFANVILHPNDSVYGRTVGIDSHKNILFDLVMYDNGPDYFSEGLVRVQRNGKMGFANQKGEIIISCQFEYASPFKDGTAQVTYKAKEYIDMDEHVRIESDAWFSINKDGDRIDMP